MFHSDSVEQLAASAPDGAPRPKSPVDVAAGFLLSDPSNQRCLASAATRIHFHLDDPMIDLFGIPLSSILLFTLAGILIGHLLWYHDRSGETEKINGLENRYFKARGSARQRKQEFLKLQKSSDSNQTDLEHLREEHQAALKRQGELERSLTELKQLRLAKRETDDALAAEQKRSASVVTQLQEVLQVKAAVEQDLATQSEIVAELQATRQEMESEIQQLRDGLSSQAESAQNVLKTIDDLQTEKQAQSQELIQLRQANQQFEDTVGQLTISLDAKAAEADESDARNQQSISELRSEVESLRATADQSAETLKQTQQDLVARCEDLDVIRAEHDDLKVQYHEASQRADNLNAELSLAQTVKTERDEFAADLETAANSLAQQRHTLESREADLAEVTTELQDVQQQLSAMSEQLTQHLEDKQTLSACILARDAETETMRKQMEELIPLRSEVIDANLRLVEQAADLEKQVELIEKQRIEFESLTAEFNQSELRYQSLLAEFEQTQVRLHQSSERVKELEPLQARLAEAGETMEKQRGELESMTAASSQSVLQYQSLQADFEQTRVLLCQSDERVKELEPLQGRLAEAEATIEKQRVELESMTAASSQSVLQYQSLQVEFEQTQAHLQQLGERVHELEPLQARLAEAGETIEKQRVELESMNAASSQSVLQYQALQAEFEQTHAQLHQSVERVKELEPLQGRLTEAGETIEKHREIAKNLQNQCEAQSVEIERLIGESNKIPMLGQQLGQVEAKLAELGEENEQQRTTINLLSANLDSTKVQLESLSKELVKVSTERDALNSTRAGLEQAVTHLRNQVSSQSAKVREVSELLSVKSREYSQTAAASKQQLESQSTALQNIRKELAAKTQEHDRVVGELTDKTRKLDQQQAVAQELRSELKTAEKLRPQNKSLQDRVADLMAHLKRVSGELDDSLDANAKGQDRIRDLESQLHDHTVKLRELRRQRGSIAGLNDDQQEDPGRRAA